jgi:ABC-type Fe3+/spermidine/putrescine transport system ATPase subunit
MLKIESITKRFGETQALADVSLTVAEGETLALVGPSGCGKSTLLGVVAGLTAPDAGRVTWDGQDLANVPAHTRGFGLMFQDYLLFPHLNVKQNVAFGLEMAGWRRAALEARVAEMLALVGLQGFEAREVGGLSGGEQQRAALARALAPRPKLLMLDEPLGALDRGLRERLGAELKQILTETGQTALYVTHDQEEAYGLGDRVAVMNAGRIEQVGTPQGVYREPGNAFVARFLGLANVLAANFVEDTNGVWAETAVGRLPVRTNQRGAGVVLLRPDAATLGDGAISLRGRLLTRIFRGRTIQITVDVEGQALKFELDGDTALPEIGETITIAVESIQVLAE